MTQSDTLGGLLKELRLAAKPKVSQQRLAQRVGITDSAIAQFEKGTRSPSPDTLERIIAALAVTKRQAERLRTLKRDESAAPPQDPMVAILDELRAMRSDLAEVQRQIRLAQKQILAAIERKS